MIVLILIVLVFSFVFSIIYLKIFDIFLCNHEWKCYGFINSYDGWEYKCIYVRKCNKCKKIKTKRV